MSSTEKKNSHRILIFSAVFLPSIGGIEMFTKNIANALVNKGYSVDIVTNNTKGLASYEQIDESIDVYRLPCVSLFAGRLPLPLPNSLFLSIWNHIKRIRHDGVLINARFYPHSILGLICAKSKKLRPVVLDHGSAYLTFGNKHVDIFVKAYEHLITWVTKMFNPLYYGVSIKSVEWLNTFNIKAEGVIPNSIDSVAFRSSASNRDFKKELGLSSDSFIVVFYGRLVSEKGICCLLEAAKLLKSFPIIFLIAGDGPLRSMIQSAAVESVKYLGRLSSADVSALLSQSNLMCLPTRSEGFSTALLEASAWGVPSVISNVGGVNELILDETYGCVIQDVTPKKVAEAIYESYIDRKLLNKRGANIQKRVQSDFNWDKTASYLLDAFSQE